jgi:circadian clock protein KaiC
MTPENEKVGVEGVGTGKTQTPGPEPPGLGHEEAHALEKVPTGVEGLDEVLRGGLPRGRPTLLTGGPGSGKTILAMEFLVNGARTRGTPGLFVSFEETEEDLVRDFRSTDFRLPDLVEEGTLGLKSILPSRERVTRSGDFSLEGLFIQLEAALERTGARNLALDSIQGLLSHLPGTRVVRLELERLFLWLREEGVTAVVTSQKDPAAGKESPLGLQEFLTDCVIHLDQRTVREITKRRLRVAKYRGTPHGLDEFPFIVARGGISVLPVTSMRLAYQASERRITTGVESLDAMFGGKGYYEGSSVLISGTAGTGKSSLAAAFAASVCDRGERCLYISFEEAPDQVTRNMRSVGLDLARSRKEGLLRLLAMRPTTHGLEEHLVNVLAQVKDFEPRAVIIDPITNFVTVGDVSEVRLLLLRLLDELKSRGITAVTTSLTPGSYVDQQTSTEVSSMMDTWIVARNREVGDRWRRELYVAKSRGMDHSVRTMHLRVTPGGLQLEELDGAEGSEEGKGKESRARGRLR